MTIISVCSEDNLSVTPKEIFCNWCTVNSISLWSKGSIAVRGISGVVTSGITKKNARTMTEKMVVKKYDPVARKHVEYKEGKIK